MHKQRKRNFVKREILEQTANNCEKGGQKPSQVCDKKNNEFITSYKRWNNDECNGTSTKRAGTTIIDVPAQFFATSMFQRISVDVPESMFQRMFVDVLAHKFYIMDVPL